MFGELIKFKASDGVELDGILCIPKKKTKTALILVHGMTGFFYHHIQTQLYPMAMRLGVAFFPFNNRGSGVVNRFSRWKGKRRTKFFGGTSFERFEDCIKDIDGAIALLRKRGFNSFILAGHSTGCQKITCYQARKQNRAVKALILLAPADDINLRKTQLGKKFDSSVKLAKRLVETKRGSEFMPLQYISYLFTAKRYYNIFKENSVEGNLFNYKKPLKVLKKINVRILAVFGRKEPKSGFTPKQMLQKIKQANSNAAIALIPGDHSFRGGEKQLRAVLSAWLKQII